MPWKSWTRFVFRYVWFAARLQMYACTNANRRIPYTFLNTTTAFIHFSHFDKTGNIHFSCVFFCFVDFPRLLLLCLYFILGNLCRFVLRSNHCSFITRSALYTRKNLCNFSLCPRIRIRIRVLDFYLIRLKFSFPNLTDSVVVSSKMVDFWLTCTLRVLCLLRLSLCKNERIEKKEMKQNINNIHFFVDKPSFVSFICFGFYCSLSNETFHINGFERQQQRQHQPS